jgi:predicted site-specific integrase-resolvase
MSGELVTTREAAELLRLRSPRTVLRYMRQGLLSPALVLPGGYRFRRDDVLRLGRAGRSSRREPVERIVIARNIIDASVRRARA